MRRGLTVALALLLCERAGEAQTQVSLESEEILGSRPVFRIESVATRFTHFDQWGRGYQSPAGPPGGPGSERVIVEQPQVAVVARQGERITHRLWVPVDVITAASPDAADAVSRASRRNKAGSLDLTSTYAWKPKVSVFGRGGIHLEETYRSWNLGTGFARSFAEDNTTLVASVHQFVDWFEGFSIFGQKVARVSRSSSNANVGVTQLLSETTVAHLGYGVTVQLGELRNTWQSVPVESGGRGQELLPRLRHRHAIALRLAQGLPWNGAAKAFYRLYADDWGIVGNTFELELLQRFAPFLYVRANYRFHLQEGTVFFTRRAPAASLLRTADSDLDSFDAHTFGGKVVLELRTSGRIDRVRIDLGYERYSRTNNLHANIYSCGLGLLF